MVDRICEHCGRTLDGMRPQARYCTPAHRAAASRDANLALRELSCGVIVQADKAGPGKRMPLYLPGQRA
jgi:hypothetical protein